MTEKRNIDPIEFLAKSIDDLESEKLTDTWPNFRDIIISLMFVTFHLYKKQLQTEKLLRRVLRD